MALRLRAARPADLPAVVALHVESWRDAYRGVLAAAFLDGPIEQRLAAHWHDAMIARRRPGAVALATAGGTIAGFVAAWRNDDRCHIDNLHVRPGMRSAGIGRAMLGFAAVRLREQGCVSAYLWVFARNPGAIRLYATLGAVIGPEVPRETQGQKVLEREVRWPHIAALIAACAAPPLRGSPP